MDVAQEEPRLAPPSGLNNGCGLHAASPPSTGKYPGSYYHRNQHKHNDVLFDEVMEMFNKSFVYQKEGNYSWSLPSADVLFTEYYQLDSFQRLRDRLNEVKNRLNDYVIEEWSVHTRRKDPAGEIPWRLKSETKAEFVTVAWCKLFECLNKYPMLVKGSKINSLHLCEAPGAFIAALNHYLHTKYHKDDIQWKWLATTLNPYYEGNGVKKMIMDDRFMLYTLDNWLFHKDFTGNIIDNDNLEHMKQQCQQRLGEVHLITADGSIDCIDAPDCQEENVALLHLAEIISTLEILSEGGSFVLKMFTLFEASSISKLYLLNCAFKKVHVFKPCTSKRGNSEVYVICQNYQRNIKELKVILQKIREKLNGDNRMMGPMFPKACLPHDFLMKHEIMCRLFMTYQTKAIESNIYSFENKFNRAAIKRLQALRTLVCDEYYRRYNVKVIPEEFKILYKYHAYIEKGYRNRIYHGSHSEREMLKEITEEEQIFKLRKELNDIERMLTQQPVTDQDQLVYEFKRGERTEPLQLTPYRGKSLETLQSTSFANVHLLIIRSELNNFPSPRNDVLWYNNPHTVFPRNGFILNFNDFTSNTSMNFSQQQMSFFRCFFENLLTHKPPVIKFVNMPLLSHFAVSILRYLSLCTYECLIFSFHPTFEITLEGMSPDFNRTVEQLKNVAMGSSSEQDILCFINIMELHHNDFNKTLTSYNNMLLLQIFKSILNI